MNSSKKTNLKIYYALGYLGRNFLYVFWKNWKKLKSPLEITWPLVSFESKKTPEVNLNKKIQHLTVYQREQGGICFV